MNLAKCIVNCHTVGVDSLVIKDAPGMVRIFIAHRDHDLWKNDPYYPGPMSVGIHSHHCDVTLVPLFGKIWNVVEEPSASPLRQRLLDAYRYQSPITSGAGKFTRAGAPVMLQLAVEPLAVPRWMPAYRKHTMIVPFEESAAWMVCEGREDQTYSGLTYSNADLEKASFAGLYQPMTPERLAGDLAILARNGVML